MKLEGKTIRELADMVNAIANDPANRMPEGSFYLFTPSARRKMDTLDWRITHLMLEKRAAEGNPVVSDGYSGRQSKRRR
jgi:hypothetical protein